MRIFVAGASGIIGRHLVPLLVASGHAVWGMTRSEEKAGAIAAQGAVPVVADVYDLDALQSAVVRIAPDAILHQLTDLPDDRTDLARFTEVNARIRVEGTHNLLAAAQLANTHRVLAQSIAWDLHPGPGAEAVAELERAVLEFGGTVLRYGQFYGPGTFYPQTPPAGPRVHVRLAAQLTVEALEVPAGVVRITDPSQDN